MPAETIRRVVEDSIEAHSLNDKMDHANKRARVARFLVEIDRRITTTHAFRDFSVDTEYSVVGSASEPKRVNGRPRSPDLLIHSRRDSRHNIFVGEVNRRVLSVPRDGPDGNDSGNVRRMLLDGLPGTAPYWLGVCIKLDEAGAIVFWWSGRSGESGTQGIRERDGPRANVLGTPTHNFAGQHEFDWEQWDNIDLL